MNIEITIPAWEDTSIEEAALANLFVSPGAHVRQGQALGEIMVEKATVEIVAPRAGVIQDVRLERGDVVKPGMVMATLVPEEAAAPVGASSASTTPAAATASEAARPSGDGAGAFRPAPKACCIAIIRFMR